MNVNVRMQGKPSIAFFVHAVIVENNMQLFILWYFSNDFIHKAEEIFAPLPVPSSRTQCYGLYS